MNSVKRETCGIRVGGTGNATPAPTGFKMFNRIVDWITNDRMQLINVTDRINEIVRKSGVRDGIVHLQSLHTTTAVFINEWQDALLHDVRCFLDDLVNREDTSAITIPNTPIASAKTPTRICAAWSWGRACAFRCVIRRAAGDVAEHHPRRVRWTP